MDQLINGRRFWSAKEAARYLGISTGTLYGYVRFKPKTKGEHRVSAPPFRRIGRNCIKFPIAEFIEWANRFDTPAQERK